MKIYEPLTYIICKSHKNKIGAFKVDNDIYLLCAGIECVKFDDPEILNSDSYVIITGEDTIPFIIYHNWCNSLSQKTLKNSGKGGKHKIMVATRAATIENDIDTDLTIEDMINDFYKGNISDVDYIRPAELYQYLIKKYI